MDQQSWTGTLLCPNKSFHCQLIKLEVKLSNCTKKNNFQNFSDAFERHCHVNIEVPAINSPLPHPSGFQLRARHVSVPESPDALSLSPRLPTHQPMTNGSLHCASLEAFLFISVKSQKFPSFLLVFSMMEFAFIRHADRWSLLTAEIIDDLV